MPAGRPTTYSQEIADSARDYLLNWQDIGDTVPSVVGLAVHIDRSDKQLWNWAKEHKELSDTLEKIVIAQHKALVNNGLDSTYNSNITKLMLSHNHGYTDKHDITSNGQSLADIAAIMGISSDED